MKVKAKAIYFVDKEFGCVMVDERYFEEMVAVRNIYNLDITVFMIKVEDYVKIYNDNAIILHGEWEEIIKEIEDVRLMLEII